MMKVEREEGREVELTGSSHIAVDVADDQTASCRVEKKPASARYPGLLIKQPLAGAHRQTFILLHGRGSSATNFGPELLATPIPGFGNLPSAFPNARFIFPTASRRRARIYKRMSIKQWFDNWSLETPERFEHFQNDGLRETSRYIHRLLRVEADLVGARNVVLGGLSQGCAASLVSLLLWEGEALAAAVGMCGWLPYRKRIEDIIRRGGMGENEGDGDDDDEEDDDDIFSRHSDGEADKKGNSRENSAVTAASAMAAKDNSLISRALESLREEIEFPEPASGTLASKLKLQGIPLFLGHGTEDEKVPFELGKAAARCLEAMDVDVEWVEYSNLGHWYSGEMLKDMIDFLQGHTGWNAHQERNDRTG
jgi:predicted esterase